MGRHKKQARKRNRPSGNPADRRVIIDFNPTQEELRLGLRRGRHYQFDQTVEVESVHLGSGVTKGRKFANGTFKNRVGDQLFFVGVPTNSDKAHNSCSFAIKVGDGIQFTER